MSKGVDSWAGYTVGAKRFENIWKALDIAKEVNGHVEFEYYNSVFCNLKGTPISDTIDYKKEYLVKLFSKEQNLFYSGGSDSHTILRLSEHLGLRWQSVITLLSAPTIDGEANDEYLPGIEYAKKKKHPLEVWIHDINHWEKVYSDPKFMYKNGGEINFRADYVHFSPLFDPTKHYITGQEKPNLIYHNGRWYTWYDSRNYDSYGGLHNVKRFFISPEMPEIYIQECRHLRDYFLSKNGYPPNGTVTGKNPTFQRDTLFTNNKHQNDMLVNDKNCLAIKQLWKMGRSDVIYNWLSIVNNHKKCHARQINWNKYFGHVPLLPWLLDIDSLESVDTAEFGHMLA